MQKKIQGLLCALALLLGIVPASAQGTLPFSMTQVTDTNGHPFVGALLYFYQVGTVATRQDSFQDTGLTIPNQWPLPTDAFGRVPPFYLASGSIHVRLTDPNGGQIFDYPSALVIGPSGGGGGGGSGVDPTSVAATGDMKFRLTTETLTGWVRLNAQTIGSAVSGASGRANADTQNLFVYLWNNCINAHCPVSSGRGASGLADFTANKTLTLPDCRGRMCMLGLDDMGNSAAGRIFASNVTSGGGDGVTTPLATGGEALHTLTQAQLPAITPTFTGTQQTWNSNQVTIALATGTANFQLGSTNGFTAGSLGSSSVTVTPSGTISSFGSGAQMNVLSNFALGTYYMKL